jgi:hypothetical protein
MTTIEAQAATGMFRNTVTGEAITVTPTAEGVRVDRAPYVSSSGTRFVNQSGGAWAVGADGAKLIDQYGSVETFERVSPVSPTAAELGELAGTYVSDDAETTLVASVEGGTLVLKRRPDTVIKLTATYKDAFSGGSLGTVVFRRRGKALELSVVQDRVWDMRFTRRDSLTSTHD